MPTWVSEHYDDAHVSEGAFVTIKDIFCDFKMSEHYQNLSKRERTLMNEKKFRSAISKSAKFKPKYREKGKVRYCSRCVKKVLDEKRRRSQGGCGLCSTCEANVDAFEEAAKEAARTGTSKYNSKDGLVDIKKKSADGPDEA